jgi:hypothetical protein
MDSGGYRSDGDPNSREYREREEAEGRTLHLLVFGWANNDNDENKAYT